MPDYNNVVEIQGREAYRIEYVQLGPKGVIELYSPPLQEPVLRLFSTQRGMLRAVGIDPDELSEDPLYCDFYALYKLSAKTGRNGKPYRNVIALKPVEAVEPDPLEEVLNELLAEVRYIGDLLTSRFTPPEEEPLPEDDTAPAPEEPAPDSEEVKEQLVAMLGLQRYIDCRHVLEQMAYRAGNPREDWTLFISAAKPRVIPAHVTIEQIMDTCALIDKTWHPGQDWRPMIFAHAYYVGATYNPGADKKQELLKATGLYLSLST